MATTKIAKGDLDERAQVYSLDEIGKVAMAMNKMTEQLVQSNKELGQFAYIASHDLQEPLRSISNYVGLFQKEFKGKMNEEADQYLAAIARSTSRMQLLIKDMLDYSRLGHDNKPCSTDCNKMLQEVQQEMSALIESTHTKLFIEELPIINCYPELKLVFQNLISNAIKFRKPDSEAIIHVSVETNSDECTFKVKDNGIGIESQYYDRIFVIFQRLHTQKEFPGSGIGLAHCKKIIEMHGGQIWVESEYGRGSTFYFTVPQINVK
jgi:light-regulated signal transduction histidine kinase (bacteriophytochrome)